MKLNIRKKLVSVAIASALTGGAMMVAPAQAMNVSQNNLGQVLVFPFYTVKNGFDTLISVTNTSDATAIIKIRWREALNSREVRDFNIVLSPYDVWTGVVTSTVDGSGAVIRTFDKSCTSPQLPAGPAGSTEIAFTNALFSGKYADGASESLDRVREGYFEVFLMGESTRSTSDSKNTLEYNAKHVNGVPRDCAKVDSQFLDVDANINPNLDGYYNILKGHSTFISVATGKAIDADPTALENFNNTGHVYPPSNEFPNLATGAAGTAWRLNDGNSENFGYFNSVDGVSWLLRAENVINEYTTGGNASSSWVLTFPTKNFYVDAYDSNGSVWNGTPTGGFSDWFFTKNGSGAVVDGKSCDDIAFDTSDREEKRVTGGTDFSPKVGESAALCYEANVIDFNNTNVFGTGINHNGIQAVGAAGWMDLSFDEAPAVTMGGLPVIGFAATVRDSGDATVNYGSSAPHAYVRAYPN
jgi:hypothetical protein